MNDAQRVQYLMGQVAALQVVLLAFIDTHPEPKVIAPRLERLSEGGVARLLPSEGSDEMLAGFEAVVEKACALARERLQRLRE